MNNIMLKAKPLDIDDQINLETEFIDKFGVGEVLYAIVSICEGKAEHISHNWQDPKTAKIFSEVAERLDNCFDWTDL